MSANINSIVVVQNIILTFGNLANPTTLNDLSKYKDLFKVLITPEYIMLA